ncbi:MAG: inorganic phosphate transporter [Planctomycetota bacterium]
MDAFLSIGIGALFCMGMGTSGMVPSFGAPYGALQIGRRGAGLLFGLMVAVGAVVGSGPVLRTLGKGLLVSGGLDAMGGLAVLSAAGCGLALGNRLRVPQSTSQVTVFAVLGTGIAGAGCRWEAMVPLLVAWVTLPVAAFLCTYVVARAIGSPPPGAEIAAPVAARWRALAVATGAYVAFAIGTNNVPNAVAPLGAVFPGASAPAFCLAAGVLFGLGGYAYGEPLMRKSGRQLAAFGPRAAAAIAITTASLLLVASSFGFPQSLVQLNVLATLGVGCAKYGVRATMRKGVLTGILLVWLAAPLVGGGLAWAIRRLSTDTALAWLLPVFCAAALVWNAWPRAARPSPANEEEEDGAVRGTMKKLGFLE